MPKENGGGSKAPAAVLTPLVFCFEACKRIKNEAREENIVSGTS